MVVATWSTCSHYTLTIRVRIPVVKVYRFYSVNCLKRWRLNEKRPLNGPLKIYCFRCEIFYSIDYSLTLILSRLGNCRRRRRRRRPSISFDSSRWRARQPRPLLPLHPFLPLRAFPSNGRGSFNRISPLPVIVV